MLRHRLRRVFQPDKCARDARRRKQINTYPASVNTICKSVGCTADKLHYGQMAKINTKLPINVQILINSFLFQGKCSSVVTISTHY